MNNLGTITERKKLGNKKICFGYFTYFFVFYLCLLSSLLPTPVWFFFRNLVCSLQTLTNFLFFQFPFIIILCRPIIFGPTAFSTVNWGQLIISPIFHIFSMVPLFLIFCTPMNGKIIISRFSLELAWMASMFTPNALCEQTRGERWWLLSVDNGVNVRGVLDC